MLHFFRRIRYRLTKDQQFSRYLRYALGEITLVVIGILIALQINNWNEKNQLRESQIEQLSKLKMDLNYDIEKMRELDSIYSLWEMEAHFLLDSILSGTYQRLESYNQYGVGRGSMYYLTQKHTTYDEMLSTGSFYKLDNDTLRNEISEFYEFANFELTKLNRDNQNFADYTLNPLQKEQKSIAMRLLSQKNLQYVDWSWLQNPESELYKELEVRANWFKYAIEANRLVISSLMEKAKNLIAIIDDELNIN